MSFLRSPCQYKFATPTQPTWVGRPTYSTSRIYFQDVEYVGRSNFCPTQDPDSVQPIQPVLPKTALIRTGLRAVGGLEKIIKEISEQKVA